MKKFFCDLDGVVFNFNLKFSQVLHGINSKYPIIRYPEEVKDWDWSTWYPAPKEHIDLAWRTVMSDPYFYENMLTIDVAGIEALKRLQENLDVYFVSSRLDTGMRSAVLQTTMALLDIGFDCHNVIMTDKKVELIKIMQPNFYLDDCPKYFTDVSVFKGMDLVGTMEYAYTRDISKDIPRYNTLLEFVKDISEKI